MPAHRAVMFLLTVGSLAGCGPQSGTAVGNGRTGDLSLTAYEAAKPTSLTLADGATIETLHVVVDRVRLVPTSSCDSDDEIDVEGPVVADLLGEGVLGGAVPLTLGHESFCSFRIGYHEIDQDDLPPGAPSALAGLSLRMTGKRSDGVPFVVESRRNDGFELENAAGFTLSSPHNPMLVGYDLTSWMAALDLAGLAGDSIIVSESENVDRLDAFEDALEESAKLFLDADGDGVLSPSELSAPLAE